MKKFLLIPIFLFILISFQSMVFAQGMMGNWGNSSTSGTFDSQTTQKEAEGKAIFDKLQSKQTECKNLTNDDFEKLGDYFMGQMTGSSHASMDKMMTQMIGEEANTQMHIAMGKRLSGCDPNAAIPSQGYGFWPMMWMMGGGGNPMMGYGGWNNMMGGWSGFGLLGWIPMLLFWILLILGVVALIRYLGKSGQQQDNRTPLEILKERYAKGEIDKKEFEQMKKDLS